MEDWLERPVKDWLEILQWRILSKSTYHGVKTWKFPLDIWMYREIPVKELPTVLVEENYAGGSALFFADLFDTLGHHPGRIIAVDIDHSNLHDRAKSHPRITFIEDDAVAAYDAVERLIDPKHDKVLVIEDASHTYEHTYEIMRKYGQLVTNGSMMIIEDTVLHNGVRNEYFSDPGAFASVRDFLADEEYACGWRTERDMERFLISWNPTGFLRKVSPRSTCVPDAPKTLSEARHEAYEEHRAWSGALLDSGRFFSMLNEDEFIPASMMSRGQWRLRAEVPSFSSPATAPCATSQSARKNCAGGEQTTAVLSSCAASCSSPRHLVASLQQPKLMSQWRRGRLIPLCMSKRPIGWRCAISLRLA